MNKKWFAAMLGAAAMAVSAGAVAQQADTGWYVGGSLGQADLDIDKDTAWKFSAGYQLNRNLSVELGYTNLGEVSESASQTLGGITASATAKAEATAWEVIGLYKFPVANQLSIYALAGIALVEVDFTESVSVTGLPTQSASSSDDSTELTFGIGAQYDVSRNLGVRAQWQRYGADEDIDVISVGVVFKF